MIGQLYREGKLYTQDEALAVFDHDWKSLATGVAIPHGLYDLQRNIGYLHIGTSHDTSEFACDAICDWWLEHGKPYYHTATSILLLCDGGGSNSSRQYWFKQDLQKLVNELGIESALLTILRTTQSTTRLNIDCSRIMARTCQGVIFQSVEVVKDLMEKAKTQTGLKVCAAIVDKLYPLGRKVAEKFKQTMSLVFDEDLPQWNYTAKPQVA